MFDLTRDGDVHVLRYDDGENRFSPAFVDGFQAALDEVAKAGSPGALVTTGTGKFYSNGLDLDWLGANGDRLKPYIESVHGLFTRLLEFSMPTVAAVNGHAFAGGGMLVLSHDVTVMREDRGYFCLPEVDLGMTFTTGMSALIQSRLPAGTAHEAMITGRRYTAAEALPAGIVQHVAPEAEVLSRAVELAAGLAGKRGEIAGRIRVGMYGPALAALHGPVLFG